MAQVAAGITVKMGGRRGGGGRDIGVSRVREIGVSRGRKIKNKQLSESLAWMAARRTPSNKYPSFLRPVRTGASNWIDVD